MLPPFDCDLRSKRLLKYLRARNGKSRDSWQQLPVAAAHKLRVVDGVLTGLHEPQASHSDLLYAFLPADVVRTAYQEVISRNNLWHEFGDLQRSTCNPAHFQLWGARRLWRQR